MYRSPLLLFYFMQNRITMSFWRLVKVFSLFLSAGIFSIFIAAASAQTTISATEVQSEVRDLMIGLVPRNAGVPVQPIATSAAVQRSLFSHPALQAGRARTCQALYRLGLNKAEAKPQVSGSISGQRKLFGHYKDSNNTDKDRAETRGASEHELDVYDVEVRLRHKLWDWNVTNNRIRAEQLAHEAERLRLDLNLSEQLLQLLSFSIRLHLFSNVVSLNQQTVADLTPHIEAIEAQGEAGFVRLAEVRRARLLLLDAEIALKEAENSLQQTREGLQTRFRLSEEDALDLLDQFLVVRPQALMSKPIETLKSVEAIELQVRQSVHDIEAIDAELLPVLDLNIDGTIFDIADFESEYEVLGQLSFSMPLYDGGSNKARLSEASWRLRELGQDKRRQLQDVENELVDILQQYNDTIEVMHDLQDRAQAGEERLESLLALAASAEVQRISIAEAYLERRSTQERLMNNQASLELLRANNLHQLDELNPLLNMNVGDGTC